jgi:hypothetical protein
MNTKDLLIKTVAAKEAMKPLEALKTEFPEGIPAWMRDLPVDQIRELMALRERAFPSKRH